MNRDDLYNKLICLLWMSSPYPGEREVIEEDLPAGGEWDEFGNYIINQMGTAENPSKTLFACHMDTVGSTSLFVNPTYDQGFLKVGSSHAACLGGDDRCGILVLSALIDAGVPGYYIFHKGEERGKLGAEYIAKSTDLTCFDRAIEFDRRGVSSVITEMMSGQVCSPEFATALCAELNLNLPEKARRFAPDPTGSYTDVVEYKKMVAEVTNVSVGYFSEHSAKEEINVLWLIDCLIPALLKVRWEDLPTRRDPKAVTNFGTGSGHTRYSGHSGHYGGYTGGSNYSSSSSASSSSKQSSTTQSPTQHGGSGQKTSNKSKHSKHDTRASARSSKEHERDYTYLSASKMWVPKVHKQDAYVSWDDIDLNGAAHDRWAANDSDAPTNEHIDTGDNAASFAACSRCKKEDFVYEYSSVVDPLGLLTAEGGPTLLCEDCYVAQLTEDEEEEIKELNAKADKEEAEINKEAAAEAKADGGEEVPVLGLNDIAEAESAWIKEAQDADCSDFVH